LPSRLILAKSMSIAECRPSRASKRALRGPGFSATLPVKLETRRPLRRRGVTERESFMSIGIWQVVLILLIVLILFGAGKLPKVMGDVAKGVKNFKSGMKEDDEDDKRAIASDAADEHPRVAEPGLKRDEAAKS